MFFFWTGRYLVNHFCLMHSSYIVCRLLERSRADLVSSQIINLVNLHYCLTTQDSIGHLALRTLFTYAFSPLQSVVESLCWFTNQRTNQCKLFKYAPQCRKRIHKLACNVIRRASQSFQYKFDNLENI